MDIKRITATVIYPGIDAYDIKEQRFVINVHDHGCDPCESVWIAMNVVHGHELPITLKCRSMMVGDVVYINGQYSVVDTVGFVGIPSAEVDAYLAARKARQSVKKWIDCPVM